MAIPVKVIAIEVTGLVLDVSALVECESDNEDIIKVGSLEVGLLGRKQSPNSDGSCHLPLKMSPTWPRLTSYSRCLPYEAYASKARGTEQNQPVLHLLTSWVLSPSPTATHGGLPVGTW